MVKIKITKQNIIALGLVVILFIQLAWRMPFLFMFTLIATVGVGIGIWSIKYYSKKMLKKERK